MSTTKKLRLGPLPRQEVTKLTFSCPASLKANLDRYAALHAQAYGETVDAATLIPYMLEAFMAGDRGFRRGATVSTRSTKAASAPISPAARAE
ncbi:DUF2274 domain-containing protein [Paraburkholderia silvatlantica]|uniref:DUF2274 domain-containing protein n=1 Tax=Paraburkholderia silvatlantica TaxID=321895 RepID=A0A2V4TAQ8_9BURK|nr:DUF2274 domain-containing protein [Paraburkholderia silvatlantica]PYE13673.1 hypothetical protein C7410_14449 [Paraburkholderia silvatlantica]TDQ81624.1 hypothetical protein C7412_12549 [Paraburkholderia silvatlantica]